MSLADGLPRVSLIVARSTNNVIGNKGQLPWSLSADLRHFRDITMGSPIVMGRKTWESLPKQPLPGRENIVISRDWNYVAEGARVFSSLGSALPVARAMATRAGRSDVFVIGGAQIYAAAMPFADRIHLTDVYVEVDGDVTFGGFDETAWTEIARTAHKADDRNEYDFVIRTLQRTG